MHLPPHLKTRRKAAAYLEVTEPTIDNYVKRGWLKRYRIKSSKVTVYKLSELDNLLLNGPPLA